MNIGIIVHSQTGNTYSVGQKIEENLVSKGHEVTLLRMKTLEQGKPGTEHVVLDRMPKVDDYDGLIFGGWVEAFGLCSGMSFYLKHISSLKDKKVACFMTEFFPFKWMGGKRGLSQMKKALMDQEADVLAQGIINWSRKKRRDEKIEELVELLCRAFAE
jgi:flavodoxin